MRNFLDPVPPSKLRQAFRAVHSLAQRVKVLEDFTALGGRLLLAIDGTEQIREAEETLDNGNVLKNHGYESEQNYGHGKKNLSSVLGGLMLLAFLLCDQLQSHACQFFRQPAKRSASRKQCAR